MVFGGEIENPGLAGAIERGPTNAQLPALAVLDISLKHLWVTLFESESEASAHYTATIHRVDNHLRVGCKNITRCVMNYLTNYPLAPLL